MTGMLMDAGSSFVQLFSDMSAVVIVLFIIGIIMCCIEMFTPGFGLFGTIGILCLIVGIVVRMVQGGDMWMLLYMVLICGTVIVLGIVLVSRGIRQGRLGRTDMFNVESSVPTGITEGTRDYTQLVGANGTTITMLRPIGQANIGGTILDVVASNSFIDSDVDVVVVGVEGGTIKVSVK